MYTESTVPNELTFEDVRNLVSIIAKKYGVKSVYLFGSSARNDYQSNSDYDSRIDLGDIQSLFEMSGLLQNLKSALGKSVDIIDKSVIDPIFIKEINDDGVLVYEK